MHLLATLKIWKCEWLGNQTVNIDHMQKVQVVTPGPSPLSNNEFNLLWVWKGTWHPMIHTADGGRVHMQYSTTSWSSSRS
jgi:hypothetical protein